MQRGTNSECGAQEEGLEGSCGGEREETQQSQQARDREEDAAAREARDAASPSRGIARAHHLSVGRSGSNTTEVGRGSRPERERKSKATRSFQRISRSGAKTEKRSKSSVELAIAESRNRAETQTAQGNRVC